MVEQALDTGGPPAVHSEHDRRRGARSTVDRPTTSVAGPTGRPGPSGVGLLARAARTSGCSPGLTYRIPGAPRHHRVTDER